MLETVRFLTNRSYPFFLFIHVLSLLASRSPSTLYLFNGKEMQPFFATIEPISTSLVYLHKARTHTMQYATVPHVI